MALKNPTQKNRRKKLRDIHSKFREFFWSVRLNSQSTPELQRVKNTNIFYMVRVKIAVVIFGTVLEANAKAPKHVQTEEIKDQNAIFSLPHFQECA